MKRWSMSVAVLLCGALLGTYLAGSVLYGQLTPPAATPVVKELTSYREVVKKVLPAVVSIESKTKPQAVKSKGKKRLPDDVPEDFRRFFEQFGGLPDMQDVPRQGFGSGFFIDPKGVILTNFHVVEGADHVIVTLMDGRKFTSRDIKGDRRTDLAIVRVDAKSVPYLELGDSDAMEIGDRVLAVGAPFGLTGSVTSGIVSAKGRNGLNMNMYEDFLQTDAAINPGNSGGPLVNLEGKAIGINAAIKSRSGGFQGVGLAVASNLAKSVTKSLLTDGVVHRGYLGVQIRDLDPEVASRLGLNKENGVVVAKVYDNTPASKAGLQDGDIITHIAGKPIKDGKTLQLTVAGLPLKQPVEVHLYREGKALKLPVTIEEQPSEFGTASAPAPRQPAASPESTSVGKIGIDIAELNDDLAEDLGYRKGTRGVVITRVAPNSIASEAGLRRGMLVTKVDKEKVTTATAARQALEKAPLARGVLLQVQSPQAGTAFVLLKEEGTGE